MTALALIAAVAKNGVIGEGNALPWRLPADLKHFRELTTGHAVIMGRKTWQSLGRALPQRQNIVVTRQKDLQAQGALVVHSLEEALRAVELPDPTFCIGGGELYAQAMPHAAVLHLTQLDRDFAGETRFPEVDREQFRETSRVEQVAPDGLRYAFVTYVRR